MMHIENKIMDELRNRGIDFGVEALEIKKNNVPCMGLRIIDPDRMSVSPIVYYSETETLDEIITRLLSASACDAPDFCQIT